MTDKTTSHKDGSGQASGLALWALGAVALAAALTVAIFFLLFGFVESRTSSAPAAAQSGGETASAPEPADDAAPADDLTREQDDDPVPVSAEALQRGETIYAQACVACHGAELRGGVGFNLVDSEWVHGSSDAEILDNIKTGFPNAGMVGFDSMYSDDQISDIIAFIHSRREGWGDISYAVRPLPDDLEEDAQVDFVALAQADPVKSGTFNTPQADFAIAEMEDYMMTVAGTLHVPDNAPEAVWIAGGGVAQIEVRIDGEVVAADTDMAGSTYRVPPGRHELAINYATAGSPEWFSRDLVILATNPETGAREHPLSEAGRRFLNNTSYEIRADDGPRVVRRRVQNLPASTISVGLPSQINYGFNTKSCTVVGVWSGAFLDIGPNIDGRGQAASFPLGDWLFHTPDRLTPEAAPGAVPECRYERVSLDNDAAPVFHFSLDGVAHSLTGRPHGGGIAFVYRAQEDGALQSLDVPEMDGFTASVKRDTDGDEEIMTVLIERKAGQ